MPFSLCSSVLKNPLQNQASGTSVAVVRACSSGHCAGVCQQGPTLPPLRPLWGQPFWLGPLGPSCLPLVLQRSISGP